MTLSLIGRLKDIAVDEDRKLIFAADYGRIKSYRYDTLNPKKSRDAGLLGVHTFELGEYMYDGPLAVLPEQGHVLKAGRHGMVAVWDVDSQPTHGKDGKNIIDKMPMQEIVPGREDVYETIEPSTGSKPSGTINLDMREDTSSDSQH